MGRTVIALQLINFNPLFFSVGVYLGNPASSMIATTNALEMVLLAYPDVPSLGSPYMPVGASADNRFYGTTNQYKVSEHYSHVCEMSMAKSDV